MVLIGGGGTLSHVSVFSLLLAPLYNKIRMIGIIKLRFYMFIYSHSNAIIISKVHHTDEAHLKCLFSVGGLVAYNICR